jgi:hypothetical protein
MYFCTLVKISVFCSSVRAVDPYNNSLAVLGTSKFKELIIVSRITEVESGLSSRSDRMYS